jgi:membrane protein insertase Oxa1/YidC/SpoIIIJ
VDQRPVEARAIAGTHLAAAHNCDPVADGEDHAFADPRMARLLKLMPLVFGIVLYRQSSALMLYWLTSNLLQLAQQWWLGKRHA